MKNLGTSLSDFILVNSVTGEDKGYLTKKEIRYLDRVRTSATPKRLNDNINKNRIEQTAIQEFIAEELGSFYFCKGKTLIRKEYIFRFLYLCTFMNYKNYLQLGNGQGESKLIRKKDLIEIFNLSRMEVYNTVKYLESKKMINLDEDEYIKVNSKFCIRGKCKAVDKVRVFDNAIKELYNNTTGKEHKKIGLLIELLEHLNFSYNVVCKNPKEEDPKLIEPLTLTEITKLLGYSTPQRLKNALFDLRVNGEKVIMVAKFDKGNMIIVNPKVYYRGTKFYDLKGIITLFDIAKKY